MKPNLYNHRKISFLNVLSVLLLVVHSIFVSGVARADIGLEWLKAQVTSEGSYINNGNLTTTFQATAEAVHTLHSAGGSSQVELQNSLSYLDANSIHNTEYLSRTIMVSVLAGQDTSELISELLKHKNIDGGFGDFSGHQSTVLDTAFALKAIAASESSIPQTTIGQAIAYIKSRQKPDGGFSFSDSNDSNVYATSLCLSALQNYIFQYNVSTILSTAVDYLLSQQINTGGWSTDWETALALMAIATIETDITRYHDAVSVLKAGQNSIGSWANDVYTTALALNALHLLNNIQPPSNPMKGTFTGRVTELSTNAPLENVTARLNDAVSTAVLTEADGRFVIADVEPGTYTLEYALEGYTTGTQTAGVNAGQQADLGQIQLARLPDTGIIIGVISDATDGLPISGAVINLSGTHSATVTTQDDGSFKIVSPPGEIAIAVTATGYHSISAVANIKAGSTLKFSPALYPTDTQPEGNTLISISGSVMDSVTGLPIPDAVIALKNTTLTTSSDNSGKFVLSQVESGSLVLSVAANNYDTTEVSFLTVPNTNVDLGIVYLNKTGTSLTSRVTGIVLDAVTGLPVTGVSISVEGSDIVAKTDAQGKYLLAGIEQLDFSLLTNASGYLSKFTKVTLKEPTTTQINFSLVPFSKEGLEIDSFFTDKAEYPAYSPVVISAGLLNSGTEAVAVKILLEILNEHGEVIQVLQGNNEGVSTATSEGYVILPEAKFELQSDWSTGIETPGYYSARIKVFDKYSNTVLSERAVDFVIMESAELEKMTAVAVPRFTHQGVEQSVILSAPVTNRSNIEHTISLQYQWSAPDGTVLQNGEKSHVLLPNDVIKTLEINHFPYTFTDSGEYLLNVQVLSEDGTELQSSSIISVAPTVRIEVEQSIEPHTIIPDGDKHIRINIRLKGVEQK